MFLVSEMHNLSMFKCNDGSVRFRFFKNHVFDHEKKVSHKDRIYTPFLDDNYNFKYGYEIDAFFPDEIERKKQESLRCSLSRTRNRILRLALSGDFNFFATFTFDGSKVNRYDYDSVCHVMQKWLRSLPPGTQYIVVPELHKDGAYHFHGLFSNFGGFRYAGRFKSGDVFHHDTIDFGYHSFVPIRDRVRCSRYIVKYITKELLSVASSRRRYWYSTSTLFCPMDLHFLVDKEKFLDLIQSFIERNGVYVNEINQLSSFLQYNEIWLSRDFCFFTQFYDKLSKCTC